jgi:hypothetical protein
VIKVELEFHSVPEAIIALNAIMNLPEVKATVAPAPDPMQQGGRRKGRADKGQKRGEYKSRDTNTPASTIPEDGKSTGNSASGVTESRSGSPAASSTVSQVPGVAASASATAEAATSKNAGVPSTIGDKDVDAQKVMEALHGKKGLDACRVLLGQFGVSRIREIPTARRAEFLEEAKRAAV